MKRGEGDVGGRFWRTAIACALFCGTIILTCGCATEVGSHTFLGKTYPAKSADHPIDVYTDSLPERPFERVALLDIHCESQGFLETNLENDGVPELKRQARAAGCDAIVEISERKLDNWSLETRTKTFSAVGIVYR